jgi:hypothetical protein
MTEPAVTLHFKGTVIRSTSHVFVTFLRHFAWMNSLEEHVKVTVFR